MGQVCSRDDDFSLEMKNAEIMTKQRARSNSPLLLKSQKTMTVKQLQSVQFDNFSLSSENRDLKPETRDLRLIRTERKRSESQSTNKSAKKQSPSKATEAETTLMLPNQSLADTTSINQLNQFNQINLNREQAAKIFRKHISESDCLTDPDYGHRIRAAHTGDIIKALKKSFHEMINLQDDEIFGFQKGTYFQLKNPNDCQECIDKIQDGEDFHNPEYDKSCVHPLGRFN